MPEECTLFHWYGVNYNKKLVYANTTVCNVSGSASGIYFSYHIENVRLLTCRGWWFYVLPVSDCYDKS